MITIINEILCSLRYYLLIQGSEIDDIKNNKNDLKNANMTYKWQKMFLEMT